MQDRSRQLDENLLQRTAGPYIRVKRYRSGRFYLPLEVRFTPLATETARRCNMLRRVKS